MTETFLPPKEQEKLGYKATADEIRKNQEGAGDTTDPTTTVVTGTIRLN